MATLWTTTNSPTTNGAGFIFTDGQNITSVDQSISGDLLVESEYTVNKRPATSQITMQLDLVFEDGGTNTLTILRYDGLGTQSYYEVLWNAGSLGTVNITKMSDKLQIARTGTLIVVGSREYRELAIQASGSSDPLKTINFSVASDAQLQTTVDYIQVYDTIEQVWNFDPELYKDIPIFPFKHNWVNDITLGTSRFGTRLEFGRGRLVNIDSSRPQQEFVQKSLFDREEAFEMLRWFDYCRGRLVPFWMPNPINLWEVVSISTTDITVKGYGLDPEDIEDFYLYIRGVGDSNIMTITGVITDGDNLVISSDEVPAGLNVGYIQPIHLVRFGRDSIREVWTNRGVCEISYDLTEVLEPAEEAITDQWGGLPGDEIDTLEFGGFPSTVIETEYFGGFPDGTL